SSGTHWDGIIVAGGKVDARATEFRVHGMIISGLNISQGINVQRNQVRRQGGGGTRTIQWDWCYATASIASLSYLIPIKNAWVDNWSTY
ncbi:MAG: hypothetical protein AAB409_09565, partial [Gemmatimonadota bacterium]